MDIAWVIFLFAVGACVGSFLNVVIHRLPRGESLIFPPSHCPACGRAIRWLDNIPLVSWWVLRGRCRWCRVRISPRYLIVEAAAACLVAGLFVWYYVLGFRRGAEPFAQTWPAYVAHAALLCGLLACAVIDIEKWMVPLEVCWVVSGVGIVAAVVSRGALLPTVSATSCAMALAAAVGLGLAMALRRARLLPASFEAVGDAVEVHRAADGPDGRGEATITAVAVTKAHGVNPRKEILWEVLYLAPAVVLAVGAYLLVTRVPAVGEAWRSLASPYRGAAAVRINAGLSALFGMLIGGLWVWGARIFGTLAFGKEAMGMGDVDILAAVGATTGWVVPSVAFFVAPFFGLAWALVLLARRRQRELPYGPWLAAATVVVMLAYDKVAALLKPYAETLALLVR